MKRNDFLLIFLYVCVTVGFIIFIIFDSLNLDSRLVFADPRVLEQFIFSVILLMFSVSFLLILVWLVVDDNSKRHLNKSLRRIINNQAVGKQPESEVGKNIERLSKQMSRITANLQKTENAYISNSRAIVTQERKRIARDLHDTVSQELFASSMMLSGVAQNLEHLDKEQLQEQLSLIETTLISAQNDLRVMLLHLRPTELQGRTLSEGISMLLKELKDKSNIETVFKEAVDQLPKVIEDNLFRIAQEFISNTLKHAHASRLEVYLYQTENEVQFKMIDNGQGFDMDASRELSYGLKNIQDRVDDLAGTMTMLSSKGKGVSMDIRLPILDNLDKDEEEKVEDENDGQD
ncbi:sensor histidine kinase [Streptococcus sobrinus]|uniref:sensor histidine kinase n=1 Tax=Streptococcus sobrinus TaxID=1310 RepID=UPI00030C9671|nr:sensor histidine kinase [Streptococcus sobrinus]